MNRTIDQIRELRRLLRGMGAVKVATSGGVDSMTLALLAARTLGDTALICHAVSPAVPAEATRRVRETARREDWRLQVLDAGEFTDADYLRNPYDRCFHCKKNLYATLAYPTICAVKITKRKLQKRLYLPRIAVSTRKAM